MTNYEVLTLTAKKGSGNVKVFAKGKGEPVVFIHGGGRFKWDDYLDELAQDYRVYAPCFPGSQETTSTDDLELYTLWDLILHYIDIIDMLKLDTFYLIGHSFGGMLASEIAATANTRVKKLLLLCPAGLYDEHVEETIKDVDGDFHSRLFFDSESTVAKEYLQVPTDRDEMLKHFLEDQIVMAQSQKYYWPLRDKGLKRRLYRIEADTTIIWGTEDTILPVGYAQLFKENLRNATIITYERTAHFPQLEQKDQVLKVTHDFFSKEYIS